MVPLNVQPGSSMPMPHSRESRTFVFGKISLDTRRRAVFRGDDPVKLSPREYELFLALARHDGAAVPRETLFREVWKGEVDQRSRTLCQHIVELRRKLERDPARPECIVTIPKFGYRVVGQWIENGKATVVREDGHF